MPDFLREGGVLKPQFLNAAGTAYEALKGANGGAYATVLGPDGTPVSSTNRLPTEATLSGSYVATVETADDALRQRILSHRTNQVELTSTPLAGSATFSGSWTDASDGRVVGLLVEADTVVSISLQGARDSSGNGATTASVYDVTVNPTDKGVVFVPPARVAGYYRWQVTNQKTTAQATLNVQELRYYAPQGNPQSLRVLLAHDLAIRNTAPQNRFTAGNTPFMFLVKPSLFVGNGIKPIFVKNGLDQEITVDIINAVTSGFSATIGSFTVAAGSTVVKTNSDFPGLDVPVNELFLSIVASATPTTGVVTAYTILGSGG